MQVIEMLNNLYGMFDERIDQFDVYSHFLLNNYNVLKDNV